MLIEVEKEEKETQITPSKKKAPKTEIREPKEEILW